MRGDGWVKQAEELALLISLSLDLKHESKLLNISLLSVPFKYLLLPEILDILKINKKIIHLKHYK